MRILFFHENFPGRFGTLASYFAADPKNEVLFASYFQRRDFSIPGVRRVVLRMSDPRRGMDEQTYAQAWARIVQGGGSLFGRLQKLNAEFAPDILFSSTFGGFSLFVQPAFPDSFHVFYAGWEGSSRGAHGNDGAMKARMSAQWVEILQSNLCFAFSEETRNHFPAPLPAIIRPVLPWVDIDFMNPAAAQPFGWEDFDWQAGQELVSINVKGILADPAMIEPLRGFVLALLEKRPTCRLLLNHGRTHHGAMLKAWRDELPQATRQRLCVTDALTLAAYRNMLCASTLHICPEATPVFLMEKIEAMSCETTLMTPVPRGGKFFQPGRNMLPYPVSSFQDQANAILHALAQGAALKKIGAQARRDVVALFSPQAIIPTHATIIYEEYEKWKQRRK